jgi:hypothetical protein
MADFNCNFAYFKKSLHILNYTLTLNAYSGIIPFVVMMVFSGGYTCELFNAIEWFGPYKAGVVRRIVKD